jgi:putative oxidoreductase
MNSTTTRKANVGATNASAFKLHSATMLVARVLLVEIFIVSGLSKLGAIQPTVGYMQAMGVPDALIYPTIAFEIAAGVLILIGLKVRTTVLLLAGFSLMTAVIFQRNFGNQIEMIMFLKNVSMAGGFLSLHAAGGGALSLDERAVSKQRS